jgi:PIN domain nuclease of toxin-antitoxin system
VIILDTHIWIWWVNDSPRLTPTNKQWIQDYQAQGLGISVISGWEVAKLVEKNRLVLSIPVEEWLQTALAYPGVQLLNLTFCERSPYASIG